MGWWPTGTGDDLIGDDAADAFGQALLEARDARAEALALPTILGAIQVVLVNRFATPLALASYDADGCAIAAEPADPELVAAVAAAVERIASSYRQDLDRDPRPAELIETAAFVLRAPPPGTVLGDRRVAAVSPGRE